MSVVLWLGDAHSQITRTRDPFEPDRGHVLFRTLDDSRFTVTASLVTVVGWLRDLADEIERDDTEPEGDAPSPERGSVLLDLTDLHVDHEVRRVRGPGGETLVALSVYDRGPGYPVPPPSHLVGPPDAFTYRLRHLADAGARHIRRWVTLDADFYVY